MLAHVWNFFCSGRPYFDAAVGFPALGALHGRLYSELLYVTLSAGGKRNPFSSKTLSSDEVLITILRRRVRTLSLILLLLQTRTSALRRK